MTVRALLVGIDRYPPPLPALRGCGADVAALAELLRARTDRVDLVTLLDGDATRSAVVGAIRVHLGAAGPDDVALLAFSGHGSQAPGADPGEHDGLDETLVLADSRSPGGWDLTDDELGALLTAATGRAGHVLVVLDCCHSGTATRGPVLRERRVPADPRRRPPGAYVPEVREPARCAGPGAVRGLGPRLLDRHDHVLLAACRADETAKEIAEGGQDRGAFSAALGAALRGGGAVTYRDVHRAATARLAGRVAHQHPQLETADPADLARPFLGGALAEVPAAFTLTYQEGRWVVDGGAVHGVSGPGPDGTTAFAVLDPTGAGAGALVASATATAVGPASAVVALSRELDEGRVFRAMVVATPLPTLTVVLGPGCEAVDAALAARPGPVTTVAAGEADLRVVGVPGGYRLLDGLEGTAVAADVVGPDAPARVAGALRHVSRWRRVGGLANVATSLPPGAVEVGLRGDDGAVPDGDGELQLRHGPDRPAFTVALTNTTGRPLWCALVDLTDGFGIYPDAVPEGSRALAPGQRTEIRLLGEVPEAAYAAGRRSVRDHLKVIVASVEFDPRPLHQGDLDVTTADLGGVRSATPPRSTLERLLGAVTTRGVSLGLAAGEERPDWRTEDRWVTVLRP